MGDRGGGLRISLMDIRPDFEAETAPTVAFHDPLARADAESEATRSPRTAVDIAAAISAASEAAAQPGDSHSDPA